MNKSAIKTAMKIIAKIMRKATGWSLIDSENAGGATFSVPRAIEQKIMKPPQRVGRS